MPTRLKRLIAPTDAEAPKLGKLTEALIAGLDSDIRPQVVARAGDTSDIAEDKWRRAVTEGLATVQTRPIADISIDASEVTYENPTYPTVEAALNKLLYVPLAIGSFSSSVTSAEVGSSINSLLLTWSYNTAVVSQNITNTGASLTAAARTYTYSTPITSDRTFILTGTDGTSVASASVSVSFYRKRHWGVSANEELTDSQIRALSGNEFVTSRTTAKTITAAGEYLYLVYPASLGEATINVNGLLNTAWVLVTRNYSNYYGSEAPYHIYRSLYKLTGTYQIAVT